MYGFVDSGSDVTGYNTVGSFSAEDLFIEDGRSGFVNLVKGSLMSTTTNFSTPVTVGGTVSAVYNISQGVLSATNPMNMYQPTVSKRPTLASVPMNGRVNYLNFSDRLDQSPWSKSAVQGFQFSINETDTFFGRDIYTMSCNTGPVAHGHIFQQIPYSEDIGGDTGVLSIYVKPVVFGSMTDSFDLRISNFSTNNTNSTAHFDLRNGTVISQDNGVATISPSYDGWYRISLAINSVFQTPLCQIRIGKLDAFTGDGSSVLISCPQFEFTNDSNFPTKYQDVINNHHVQDDVNEGYQYLKFDSIDDTLEVAIPVGLRNVDGDVFIAGLKKSFVFSHRILGDKFTVGPISVDGLLEEYLSECGGLIGIGYIYPRLSFNECKKLFDYFGEHGANTNFNYPIDRQIADVMTAYNPATTYELYYPHSGSYFSDTAGTTRVSAYGGVVKAFRSHKGSLLTSPSDAKLKMLPYGGVVRNILKYTETYSNSYWLKEIVGSGGSEHNPPAITDNYAPSPFGKLTASRVIFSVGSVGSGLESIMTPSVAISETIEGNPYTFSFWMKSNSTETYELEMGMVNMSGAITTISVTPEWQRFSITGIASANVNRPFIRTRIYGTLSRYADVLLYGPQYEQGEATTNYQHVKNLHEVYEIGKKSVPVIQFDGVDDYFESDVNKTFGANYMSWFTFSISDVTKNHPLLLKSLATSDKYIKFYALEQTGFASPTHIHTDITVTGLLKGSAHSNSVAYAKSGGNLRVLDSNAPVQTVAGSGYSTQSSTSKIIIGKDDLGNFFGGNINAIFIADEWLNNQPTITKVSELMNDYIGAR